jgi:hypothetical protein
MKKILWLVAVMALALAPAATLAQDGYIPIGENLRCVSILGR